jgi:hypothetical protein
MDEESDPAGMDIHIPGMIFLKELHQEQGGAGQQRE